MPNWKTATVVAYAALIGSANADEMDDRSPKGSDHETIISSGQLNPRQKRLIVPAPPVDDSQERVPLFEGSWAGAWREWTEKLHVDEPALLRSFDGGIIKYDERFDPNEDVYGVFGRVRLSKEISAWTVLPVEPHSNGSDRYRPLWGIGLSAQYEGVNFSAGAFFEDGEPQNEKNASPYVGFTATIPF